MKFRVASVKTHLAGSNGEHRSVLLEFQSVGDPKRVDSFLTIHCPFDWDWQKYEVGSEWDMVLQLGTKE